MRIHHENRWMICSSVTAARPPPCYNNHQQCNVVNFSTIKSSIDHKSETSSSPLPPSSAATKQQGITNINTSNEDSTSNEESPSLLEHYESLIKSGEVTRDPHQIRALRELDRLRDDCLRYSESPSFHFDDSSNINGVNGCGGGGRGNDNGWSLASCLFSLTTPSWSNSSTEAAASSSSSSSGNQQQQQHQLTNSGKPKGVYLHGGVGCGKTYCMDLFYNSLPENPSPSSAANLSSSAINNNIKQKVHFHKFMLNIHKSIHTAKTSHHLQGNDLINHVIQTTLSHGKIICFDEFQVTDIADALLLKRLFTALLERGAVVVATSNRPPSDLYKGGLQRSLFLPFIELLNEECTVVSMWESDMDYRLVQKDEEDDSYDGSGKTRVYFVGNDDDDDDGATKRRFDRLFANLTKGSVISSMVLDVQGREVLVPAASEEYNIARFSFNELCAKAKGAGDYLAIGERFHTVFIEDVPKLQHHEVNLVRRWITLIDALYENHVKLVIQAETKPEEMFQVDLENEHCDEVFAFDRTRSRMEEMRSEKYLRKKWTGHLQFSDDVDRAKRIDYMQ